MQYILTYNKFFIKYSENIVFLINEFKYVATEVWGHLKKQQQRRKSIKIIQYLLQKKIIPTLGRLWGKEISQWKFGLVERDKKIFFSN